MLYQMRTICVFAGSGPGADPAYAAGAGFIPSDHTHLLLHATDPAALLGHFAAYTPPHLARQWTELPPKR